MTETAAAPPAPPLLPWPLVARIMAVFGVPMVALAVLVGPEAAAAAVLCGVLPGFGAMAMGKRDTALGAMAVLVAATAVMALAPIGPLGWAIAFGFALAAGWEATVKGGRAFVLAMIGFVALVLIPSMPAPGTALPFLVGGLAWGALATHWLNLTGMLAPPPRSRKFGASLAVFLFLGLLISAGFTQWVEQRYAYWIVLLFVFRTLSPDQGASARLWRYAVGSIIGGMLAMAATFLAIPSYVTLVIAIPLGALAMRHAAQPTSVSAAAATASVLLIMPVSPEDILFRLEAVIGVILMIGALMVGLTAGWRLVDPEDDTI